MTAAIPPQARDLLAEFASGLPEALDGLRGAWITGSIALDDFRIATSDIDFLVVTERPVARAHIAALGRLHAALRRDFEFGGRLEGLYVPRAALAAPEVPGRPEFPYVQNGRLRGRAALRPAACHLVREKGLVLWGAAPAALAPPVPRGALDAEMDWNLRVYWPGRLRRPWRFLADRMVDFAVLTIPRILITRETGRIVSKREALGWLEARHPRWRPLADDVRGRIHPRFESPPPWGRLPRAALAWRFVREMTGGKSPNRSYETAAGRRT